jgi:uncharacterized protein YndB with AHSA1/START domain
MTWDRHIEATPEAVWSVIADPHAMVAMQRHTRVISTEGEPGEVGSRYRAVSRFTPGTMEAVVAEAVVGRRLVVQQIFPPTGVVICIETADLRREGEGTLLTWTYTQPQEAHPLLHRAAALGPRLMMPRLLSKLEREIANRAHSDQGS